MKTIGKSVFVGDPSVRVNRPKTVKRRCRGRIQRGDMATVTWSNLPERLKGRKRGVNCPADA